MIVHSIHLCEAFQLKSIGCNIVSLGGDKNIIFGFPLWNEIFVDVFPSHTGCFWKLIKSNEIRARATGNWWQREEALRADIRSMANQINYSHI